MIPPVVVCTPVVSKILLIGQAPGDKEGGLGRPFAWTAGKTLFKWFESIGQNEGQFREQVYMTAVCRCFPGKNPKGGDRVPNREEVSNCSVWWQNEIELLQPELVIPVGKLAIAQFMPVNKLVDVVGQEFRNSLNDHNFDLIPLPHPSGASTWFRTEPGKHLLEDALSEISSHRAWRELLNR